jgi:anti-sigma regulatory factor (Ser/Thr protein kinase)
MHQIYRLDLCLNEVLANILNHGGEAALASAILLNFGFAQNENECVATIVIADSGKEFNPLTAEQQTTPQSLDEAEPGGLGLKMLFKFADNVSYQYQGGRNHLSFSVGWKNIP